MGVRLHDSGMTTRTGGIIKAGRREMRAILVEAAQVAVLHDPRWKAELKHLEPRLGRNKAVVAIARKLLVVVWHVLTKDQADRHADPERLSRKFLRIGYRLGKPLRPEHVSCAGYVRQQLDRLGLGRDLTQVSLGRSKPLPLPPSTLPPD